MAYVARCSPVLGALLVIVGCSGSTSGSDGNPAGIGQAGGGVAAAAGNAAAAGKAAGGSSANSSGGQQSVAGSGTSGGGGDASSQSGGSASAGSQNGGTSNHDSPDCKADFDALDRTCSTAADCVLVEHQINCCGQIQLVGLPAGEKAAFDALEQYCAPQFPLCGCAAFGVKLEDGTTLDDGATNAVADCISSRCQSRKVAGSSSCGSLQCSDAEYCEETLGGIPESQPRYACRPLGDCRDCACLKVPACQCSQSSAGAVKVTCAAP